MSATADIQAGIDARGIVDLGHDDHVADASLIMRSGVTLRGSGTLSLANGVNDDLIRTEGFAELTGSGRRGGPTKWRIEGLTLDGNRAHNASGRCLRAYAYDYDVKGVDFKNGASGNVYSENGGGGADMECRWEDFKLYDPADGTDNMVWLGPNDSQFEKGIVARTGATSGGGGIRTGGGGAALQLTDVHVYGPHRTGWNLAEQALLANCEGEGALETDLLVLKSGTVVIGGQFFGDRTHAGVVGIQLGDANHFVGQCIVNTYSSGYAAGSFAIRYRNAGYNSVCLTHHNNAGATDCYDPTFFPDSSELALIHTDIPGTSLFQFPDTADLRGRALKLGKTRLFERTSGGKAQVCVQWPSGAVTALATDPTTVRRA